MARPLGLDAAHELVGELLRLAVGLLEVREDSAQRLARIAAGEVELVERLQRALPGPGPRAH